MPRALYAAYFTGLAGQSMGLFYIGDGVIVGIDVSTMQYDGTYLTTPNGSLEGTVSYVLPAGVPLITGAAPGAMATPITVELKLPANFDDGRVVSIDTPTGPVNARFEKVKELP
jgi:hypothetical protein